jgi:hypothetical protein
VFNELNGQSIDICQSLEGDSELSALLLGGRPVENQAD